MNSYISLADQWAEILESSDSPPELSCFLSLHPAVAEQDALELFLVDQQWQWSTRPGPSVESYLRLNPNLDFSRSGLVDLIYGEARAKEKLGQVVDTADFYERFPHAYEHLKRQFRLQKCLKELPSRTSPIHHCESDPNSINILGMRFNDYDIVELVSCSGMKNVFKALHRPSKHLVALKTITSDSLLLKQEVVRFKNESNLISTLDHPCILPILDDGEFEGVPYYTSRFIESGTLESQVEFFRGNYHAIARFIQQLADAIRHAHSRRILHRDIKPANVLVDFDNQPLLVDFGLASLFDVEDSGAFAGTPIWMAPEVAWQVPGGSSVASDIYGIGAVLYFLLTGRPPYSGGRMTEVLELVKKANFVDPSQIDSATPEVLEQICLKSMSEDPKDRYPTAESLVNVFEAYLCNEPRVLD